MSVEKTEIETYFGRCRCCLSYGYLKNMWAEHDFEGETEIYGEMLVQCFALSWDQSEDAMDQDQICEQCICRLRDASDFKKVVLDSQEELLHKFNTENEVTVKEEAFEVQYLEEDIGDTTYADTEYTADTTYADTEYTADTADTVGSTKDETEYQEIEYLEDDNLEDIKDIADTDSSQPSEAQTSGRKSKRLTNQEDDEAPKRKWPKKLPKAQRLKTYRQYSEETFRKCMEVVRNGEMTPQEAAEKYKIPKKTICAKLKMDPKGEIDQNREKMYQFIQEIKTILTYTNATPYKSKNVRYYCAYCSTDGPHFEEPDDLRTHTRTQHAGHRIEKIEYAMRPYWMNEVIKLDIQNLMCSVCCTVIISWNDMFKHLKEKHDVHLDQAYSRAIPYILTSDLKCALCKESFTNYLHLDGHMNAHYNSYVCDDCGDTFLAQSRLKHHVKIHDVGKFPCTMCDKVFTLLKYRRKHEDMVHEQISKFKCLYCTEKFTGEYLRHLHCLEMHREKVKSTTCELCGKIFTWKPYYMAHLRKKHQSNRKFMCDQCDRKFLNHFELREHLLRHLVPKKFECNICYKKYATKTSLKQHEKLHAKNSS